MHAKFYKNLLFAALFTLTVASKAENGYNLWMRYLPIENKTLLSSYQGALGSCYISGSSATTEVIQKELNRATDGLIQQKIQTGTAENSDLIITKYADLPLVKDNIKKTRIDQLGDEGYLIKTLNKGKQSQILITAKSDIGLLYGTFHLIRLIQTQQSLTQLNISESPKTQLRVLNHWDNLDRTSERGYAGFSLWDWHRLPDYTDPRYEDYARANASIGINGTVLTNVNANAWVLSEDFLPKVKALADVFRPYGIKVYLTARFSAPIEIGGLETADPLDKDVISWWKNKTEEIYEQIPDFGGFLVKANSEGQPGPQNYGRSHAEGANMLADALSPHGGVVMWRAFVYSHDEPDDRAKQAYNEFQPLDGTFKDNVLVQVKNGAIDFQPREPFHPLFGAMPKTPLMMEFQVTQEYLGQATQLVYLAPMWKECLNADTYAQGKGSTVEKVIDGSLHQYKITGIAGVANTGTDLNWTGHPFGQANWYAYGRLAWDMNLDAADIANEWIKMTFSNDENVVKTISEIMLSSWEAAVSYMTPLGLHHLMGTSHHYGPAPWVDELPRADWNPVYYHKADQDGIGFDRSKTGSNATSQYFPEVANEFNQKDTCPEKFLLWFHHVSWDYEMKSGRILWDELAYKYQLGVNDVRNMQQKWLQLQEVIDAQRFTQTEMLLKIQEKEAIWWKDACMLYFQQFSDRPFPDFMEQPAYNLNHYKSLKFPFAPGIKPNW